MSKERRLELINHIQEQRHSTVVVYVLSDRRNSEGPISAEAVREIYGVLRELKPMEKKALDLFLCGSRGDNAVPWRIVSMFRELFDVFNVLLPYKAYSAATMIALGADTIIMGEKAELSPIDVNIPLPYDTKQRNLNHASAADVTGFFSWLEGLGKVREKQRIDAFLRTMDSLPPLLLGKINKALEQTKNECRRLLESRNRPFGRSANNKIIGKLFSDFSSPEQGVSRKEARRTFGLKHVQQDEAVEPLIWELWALYEEEFKSRDPFFPEDVLEESEEDEITFHDHKLTFIETTKRTRVHKEDVKIRRLREYPPDMQFDPQIVLPSIPLGSDEQEESLWTSIQQWLQSNLPLLMDDTMNRFKKTLPTRAYERLHLRKRWVDE
ncbi:MAG: hypothetical protein P8175_09675 [Deltaproteobacteria bacterium]